MAANRGTGFAAFDCADIAGTIASRSGSASAAPTPRMNVRRGNAIFLITMSRSPARRDGAPRRSIRALLRHPHLKRRARDDALHDRRKTVGRARRLPLDLADRRRVEGLESPPERIGQQLLGERGEEV